MTEPAGAPQSLLGTSCGPYRILDELGAGAMGTVYLASEEGETAPVALKLFHPHLLRRKGFFTRFRREAEAGRQVDHPNVVRTHDCDLLMVNGALCFFLVMEYAEGQTLRDLLLELGKVPEGLLREIAVQLSAGLAAIHAEDIVHRDLKPENVLFAKDQRIRIMDLGVAKMEGTSVAITMDGKFAGSLLYVAPEQIRQEAVGPAADLYSLGVMLYELALGENPFMRDSAAGVMYAHLHHEPPALQDMSPFLAAVIQTLLAKAPGDRFHSAAALHRALKEVEKSAWWQERREDAEWRTARKVEIPVRRGTRLYGRDKERRTLNEAWERARGGAGGMVLLEGEAGIGKTRLVDSFAQAAASEGATVLYGSYAPSGGGDALAEAVLQHTGEGRVGDELDWYLPRTPALVPAFAALLRQEPPPEGSTPLEGGALHSVWCQLMHGLAEDGPLVWIAEDLQFASAESRRLLLAMLRAAKSQRVMLVTSSRTPLPPAELEEFERLNFQRLPLPRLRPEEVMRLLHDAFRNRELAEKLGGRIAEKSDGVPFFVCEMIRGLCERKFLSPLSDGRFVEARAIGKIEVPSAVRDLLEARLSDVAPEERAVLDVGAVQGYEFDPDVTARVLGLEKVTVLQRIALLERRWGVLRGHETTCRFDHHLVQEVLYEAMLPSLRAEYHARVADALRDDGEIGGRDAYRIARHYLRGARPDRAFPFVMRALAHLGREHRNQEKMDLADQTLAGAGLADDLRVRVLLEKADALFVAGRRAENIAVLEKALQVASRVDDPAPRLAALLELAGRDVDLIDSETADKRIAEALRLARELKDPAAEARAQTTLGMLRGVEGRLDEGIRSLERAVSLAHDAGSREAEARALASLGFCMLQCGRNEEARTRGERSLLVTREAGRPVVGVIAMLNLAAAQSRLGDTLAAEEMQEQALELAGSIGYRGGEALAAMALANTRSQLGRAAEARRWYDRALSTARVTGERALEARVLGEWGAHWMSIGRTTYALRCFENSLRAQQELGDPVWVQLLRIRKSHVEAELGRGSADEVRDAVTELQRLQAKAFEGYGFFVLGRIAEIGGDPEEARKRYRQSLHRRRGTHERTAAPEVLNALGFLEIRTGSMTDASLYLKEARSAAKTSTLPNLDAVAKVYLALTPKGDADAACEMFAKQEMRIPHLARLSACFALWKATDKRPYLEEAQRLVLELRDGAPTELKKAVLEDVPLHAEILAAARS